MSRPQATITNKIALFALAAVLLCATGCAFTVVRPAPLVVGSDETHNLRIVKYPAYVLVHDSESNWDAHQIKDNIVGLTEGEVVHWLDLAADAVVPFHHPRPIEHGIDWIKNSYAQLPNCAPVRIVDGFFSAIEIDRTTAVSGGTRIASAPSDPISYLGLLRVIYLTDWLQDTAGEVNTGLGYITPWPGPFIPKPVTRPINAGVDYAQFGVVTLYIRLFRKVDAGVNSLIDGCEHAWGGLVYAALWSTHTLNIAEDKSKTKEVDVGNRPGPGSQSK